MKKQFIAIAAFTMLLASCHKEVTATITIVEPASIDTIPLNNEVHFEGTIDGTAEMHGYTIKFTNMASGAALLSKTEDSHAKSNVFHEHWINNVTDTTTLKLSITVEKDHDGHTETKEATVVCLPQ
jgi:hypothetical protein